MLNRLEKKDISFKLTEDSYLAANKVGVKYIDSDSTCCPVADAQYGLAGADDINDYDVTIENNGIKIVMGKDVAVGFSDGSIDFVADETDKNFVIQNAESGTCDNCEECDICDIE